MDRHTFKGKERVCTTDLIEFTDFQGIHKDPLYKRYPGVASVIQRLVALPYTDFLAQPDYREDEGVINWYIPKWGETPERLTELAGERREHYMQIKDNALKAYRDAFNDANGEDLDILGGVLKYINDDFIFCTDDRVYVVAWGMTPNPTRHIPVGSLVYNTPDKFNHRVVFNSGDHGVLSTGHTTKGILVGEGQTLEPNELPPIKASEGYEFAGWSPDPLMTPITDTTEFTALYTEVTPVVEPPEVPTREEEPDIDVSGPSVPPVPPVPPEMPTELPQQVPIDPRPPRLPWYKRLWAWFKRQGWLKWVILALLLAILFLVLFGLLRGCKGCRRQINGVVPIERKVLAPGDTIDDIGFAKPLPIVDGRLPEPPLIAAPIRGEDGKMPTIVREPGVPSYMAGRLMVFLIDENDDVDKFADDFKKAYPGSDYSIIGYDRYVKSLTLSVPEEERANLRETMEQRIPNHNFLVFDEEIYELNGHLSETTNATPGWHLKAVNAQEGWAITKGSPQVVIAIVDDGIDPSHPMFEGRIKDAYNVFTRNNHLSSGQGHGTHTAGLAAGSLAYLDRGAAGIAPDCMIMPVQVCQDNMIPLSALVSGIMYSVHQGADVINVSIGPNFPGLNALPVSTQEEIAQTRFKNIEQLWKRVSTIVANKKSILIFAAGNDDIISAIPPENRNGVAMAIGAVDQLLMPTEFTNYGPCTDISAPGTEILSSYPGGNLMSMSGTSMSAPIISGTVALMKTLDPQITVEQAFNVLYKTGKDVYGYMPPMVQVNLALDAVKRKDYSKPEPRPIHPVPTTEMPEISEIYPGGPPNAIVIPVGESTFPVPGGAYTGPTPVNGRVIIDDTPVAGTVPDYGEGPGRTPGQVIPAEGDDYEEIRRLIEEYKQKIVELEKQLPENR